MEKKYNLLIKNSIFELVDPASRANITTKKQYFKLKKNWFGHILKYKAR